MNESANRGTAVEGIFGLLLVFAILIFAIYKFGTSHDSVVNDALQNATDTSDTVADLDTNSENGIYNKYIKQIYDAQTATNTGNKSAQVDQIISDYQSELQNKTDIPTPTIVLKNVSDKFTPSNYKNNFEIIWDDFKTRGGTSENKIILAQILDDGTLLPLSDYDKETLLRTATEYEVFAEKIQNLSTPKSEEKIATEVAASATNISYILKQMVNEPDKQVYTLWISKYLENMSVIITDRYGINQK